MFGSNSKGPFGTNGMNGAGDDDDVVEAAGETVNPGPGGPVQSGPEPQTAGQPEAQMAPPAALMQELDTALAHARHAQHRLIDLVAPGSMDAAAFNDLHSTYATLQQNIADVAAKVQAADSEDALMAANRDAREVLTQVQQYVEAVETVVGQSGGAVAVRKKGSGNGMMIFALLIGAGAAGYGIWQIKKRSKK